MSRLDFDSIATRLRWSHGLTSRANGDVEGTMHGLFVQVQCGTDTAYAVEVSIEVEPGEAPRVRRSLQHRVMGLPSEVAAEIGGKGTTVRARLTDPGSMLDSLAMVGAIEAMVNAMSLVANAQPMAAGRRRGRVPTLTSAVSQT